MAHRSVNKEKRRDPSVSAQGLGGGERPALDPEAPAAKPWANNAPEPPRQPKG
ncbi:hypothetical protein [Calditerricola satsumensis]|uniref:Uncharacterized protein n=1 Tax=Calditerricola satsumensis TaxID=373054 RepID=A0A8J3BGC1_9BACI|nr:hypothetical protein [Calditerricola satsumensis]GGK05643.1 hypothetical protein GCM10007043_19590 [Calditerricola satsumensis]